MLIKLLKLLFNLASRLGSCETVMELSRSRWFHEHQQWLEPRTALQLAPRVNQSRISCRATAASAPLTRRLAFVDVMMNCGTSCTPITASAKPHQPPLVAVASFEQAASHSV
jgi:hypothetical protein